MMLRRLLDLWLQHNTAPQQHSQANIATRAHAQPRTNAQLRANAHAAVEAALQEISATIRNVEEALRRAEEDKGHIAATLHEYVLRAEALHMEAKNAVQARNDEAARELLQEQHAIESMIAAYGQMTTNIGATVKKLHEQQRRMLVQRDEIKARRTVIEAQLSAASSEEDFMRNLHTLGLSHEVLEQELLQASIRGELGSSSNEQVLPNADEYTLSNTVQRAALTQSAEEAFAALNAELEREREQRERLDREAVQKRFATAFQMKNASASTAPTPLPEQSPQDKLKAFFNQSEPSSNRTQETLSPNSLPQQAQNDLIKNFFDR